MKRDRVQRQRRLNEEGVIISRGEGETYADLLKKVKEKVNINEVSDVTIKEIRETKKGDMLVVVKGRKGQQIK